MPKKKASPQPSRRAFISSLAMPLRRLFSACRFIDLGFLRVAIDLLRNDRLHSKAPRGRDAIVGSYSGGVM